MGLRVNRVDGLRVGWECGGGGCLLILGCERIQHSLVYLFR